MQVDEDVSEQNMSGTEPDMEVDDSSDDEASMTSRNNQGPTSSLSMAKSKLQSPAHKRPKRSTSRSKKGNGGPTSSNRRSNE